MPDLVDTIDALLAQQGAHGGTPAPRTHAAQLTHAALALVAIMRTPEARAAQFTDATVDPRTGRISLQLTDQAQARALADRLDLLQAARVTEVDHGWVARRWTGHWADWPIVLLHMEHDDTIPARAAAATRTQAAGL